MEEQFNFREVIRLPSITLGRSGAYINRLASDALYKRGRYVKLLLDPERQAIRCESHDEPGEGRYLLSETLGSNLRTRQRLRKEGMEDGIYVNIGNDIFQHTEHL